MVVPFSSVSMERLKVRKVEMDTCVNTRENNAYC